MNLNEYIRNLQNMTGDAVNQAREKIYVLSGNELLANIKNRIQRQGVDSSGSTMPGYSSKPSYFTRNQFVKRGSFKPIGKTGKRVFTNGNPHKSMYIETGYKGFREVQGRQTDKRDLTLSGDLMLSYVLGTSDDAILLGFNQTKQSKKRKGLEKRNGGKIFTATDQELKDFNARVIAEENKIIQNAFRP